MFVLKYFTIKEMCTSKTAELHNINNEPNSMVVDNLKSLIINTLDPLREKLQQPIYVSSGYRSVELNKKIGGSKNSQHLTGQAADIYLNKNNGLIYETVLKYKIPFDQMILEKGTIENPRWVHLSFVSLEKNRSEVLYYNGKNYIKIK